MWVTVTRSNTYLKNPHWPPFVEMVSTDLKSLTTIEPMEHTWISGMGMAVEVEEPGKITPGIASLECRDIEAIPTGGGGGGGGGVNSLPLGYCLKVYETG